MKIPSFQAAAVWPSGEAEAAQKLWEGWTGLENLEQRASNPSGAPSCCPSLEPVHRATGMSLVLLMK